VSDFVYDLIGLTAGVFFILALKGLSHPRTARRGNLIGALGAGIATVVVFFHGEIKNLWWILGAIAVGTIVGVPAARTILQQLQKLSSQYLLSSLVAYLSADLS